MIYQEHVHRKLRQAFDAILRQFSSNGNRKTMLSANRSFQAQNSTCSTLLQTMLLYETCIVLSRKCLWDVNKDFWHQWRSLAITTLSARAIYRQIPVSYLQTWYIQYNVYRSSENTMTSRSRCSNREKSSFCLSFLLFRPTPILDLYIRSLRWRYHGRTCTGKA